MRDDAMGAIFWDYISLIGFTGIVFEHWASGSVAFLFGTIMSVMVGWQNHKKRDAK